MREESRPNGSTTAGALGSIQSSRIGRGIEAGGPMTSPWTEPESGSRLTRGQWIGLAVLFVVALGFGAIAWFGPGPGTPLDPNVIVGDWKSVDPPWRLSFRPDKTVELVYDGNVGSETLAPTLVTPGVPVEGEFVRTDKGVYRLKLDNGKIYEAQIGRYKVREKDKLVERFIENRMDLTDVDGASGVVVFNRIARTVPPVPTTPDDTR
jgi:hypothetical protein